MLQWLGSLYEWFWVYTEFWLTPVDRRPYTFIMKDWIFTHVKAFIGIAVVWFAGVITLSYWHGTAATVIGVISAAILAHLVWGAAWIEDQQEFPDYLG